MFIGSVYNPVTLYLTCRCFCIRYTRGHETGGAPAGCRPIGAHQAEAGRAGSGKVGRAIQAAAGANARADAGGSAAQARQTDQSGER